MGMSYTLCGWPGCSRHACPEWDLHGRYYCGEHHFPGLEQAFLEEYATWDGVREPTEEFKNLFSRYVERIYPAGGMPEKMSQASIESRGASWKKTRAGLEFSIDRHLTTYHWGWRVKSVSQEWRFDLQTKELVLLERPEVRPQRLEILAAVSRQGIPANTTAPVTQ